MRAGGGDEGAVVPTDAGALDSIAGCLAQLPMPVGTDSTIEVRVGDLDRASELVGLPSPTRESDPKELSDWSYAVLGVRLPPETEGELRRSPVAVPQPHAAAGDLGENWGLDGGGRGWTFVDMEWFAEVSPGEHTPHLVGVLGGEFSEERLTASLGPPDSGVWSRDPASIGERGVLTTGMWAHAGLAGDHLVVSDSAESVRAANSGQGPTLADNDVLVALAEALDGYGAYSALLRYQAVGFPFPQRR